MMNMLMTKQLCISYFVFQLEKRYEVPVQVKGLSRAEAVSLLKSSPQTDGKLFVRLSCSHLNVDTIRVVLRTFQINIMSQSF